jgi:tetratricopeptide (TPR) repeat protein
MKFLSIVVLCGLFVFTAISQTPKSKTTAKPGVSATPSRKPPVQKLNEKSEWEKAIALSDMGEKIVALKKFVTDFPHSANRSEASGLIAAAEGTLGNERLAAEDIEGASVFFKSAVMDAPTPVPTDLFANALIKFPANLYFRGAREAAIETAKTLEQKAAANSSQLIALASFYLSIENGSEAKRIAEDVIKLEPASSDAYQTLGLAYRMDFQLEESAATYVRALDLQPDSMTARRGLAEMDRSLGKSEEAINIYREILAKEEANVPARTGLVLALFDAGRRDEGEAELAKALDQNPGNVMLLASAAYSFAVHDDGAAAVAFAQKAIQSDPRFIWSHIALARGLMAQKRPVDAERVLLAARRYGNFPTLEYEIASARLAAGLYREAAEELSKSFTIKDGVVSTKLGGRVPRESKYFSELIGYERRASIFAPTAADNPESAAQLTALLQLKQETDAAQPNTDLAIKAVDDFVRGDDAMKVHRQLYAASQLLDKKVGLAKVLELAKAAPQSLDAGLKIPDPVTPVLAGELYEGRRIALTRGEFINTPNVPANTLSAILRGRVEDLIGWAMYETDDAAGAVTHLRRAVSVLPADSAWWRTTNWRLGNALALAGKDAEALDTYIKTYKAGTPDPVRYAAIEALYKRVNGSTDGLEAKIGINPAAPAAAETAVTQTPEPTPAGEGVPSPTANVPIIGDLAKTPDMVLTPTPEPMIEEPARTTEVPLTVPTAYTQISAPPAPARIEEEKTPVASPSPSQGDTLPSPLISPTEVGTPAPTPEVERSVAKSNTPIGDAPASEGKKELFAPVIITIPPPETGKPVKNVTDETPRASPVPVEKNPLDTYADSSPTPTILPSQASTNPSPTVDASVKIEEWKPDVSPTPVASETATITPSPLPVAPMPSPETIAAGSPSPTPAEASTPSSTPSVIDNGSPSPSPSPGVVDSEIAETSTREPAGGRIRVVVTDGIGVPTIKPCGLTVSEENISLRSGGGDLAVIVGRSDDIDDLEGLKAVSTSPQNVTVRREVIEGVKARALFVVRSITTKPGVYQVRFEMPCGKKEIVVRVR